MTIPQIKGFLAAIAKRKCSENIRNIYDTSVATQGNNKNIKKAVKLYTTQYKELTQKEDK
mgnify:CR=1 FL=1